MLFRKITKSVVGKLPDPYISENGDTWDVKYHYETIDFQLVPNCAIKLKTGMPVEFSVKENISTSRPESVLVLFDQEVIGYINKPGQRSMLHHYILRDGHMVLAQISKASFWGNYLRINYYISRAYLTAKREKYEVEKAAYQRKPPVSLEATLIKNQAAKYQNELSIAKQGDQLYIEYDDDDRLVVLNDYGIEIGFLGKRDAEKIEELTLDDVYDITNAVIVELLNVNNYLNARIKIYLEDKSYTYTYR